MPDEPKPMDWEVETARIEALEDQLALITKNFMTMQRAILNLIQEVADLKNPAPIIDVTGRRMQ